MYLRSHAQADRPEMGQQTLHADDALTQQQRRGAVKRLGQGGGPRLLLSYRSSVNLCVCVCVLTLQNELERARSSLIELDGAVRGVRQIEQKKTTRQHPESHRHLELAPQQVADGCRARRQVLHQRNKGCFPGRGQRALNGVNDDIDDAIGIKLRVRGVARNREKQSEAT
jgi:hypothetical protein